MPVSKGPDCVGDEMALFHKGQLHSGKSKKPVKSEKQAKAIALSVCGKSKYAEMIESLGFSEEAAAAYAEVYDYISAKDAENDAAEGPLGDIDSTPGKQKGDSGRRKQAPQGEVSSFPTLPNQTDNPYAEGPMVRARNRSCPVGTRAVGNGWCKNTKPGKRQYFEIEKGKGCPPGSRPAGKGRCRVDFSEFIEVTAASTSTGSSGGSSTACPEPKSDAQKQADKGTQPNKPKGADAGNQTETPKVKSVEQSAEAEAKKQQREACKKNRGN
jgi:hypothetical protein